MKVVKAVVCEICDKHINPGYGIILQGNVYIVPENLDERPGIINNIAFDERGNMVGVQETAYHTLCLINHILESVAAHTGTMQRVEIVIEP